MLAGRAAVVAAACLRRARAARRCTACRPLLAFALLAAYTALSIVWSLAPADSWLEANRTFAYLAVVRRRRSRSCGWRPGRWAELLYGVLAGHAWSICAWALLTKVFPASLAADETLARLRAPFEYWNSVGLMAAIGVPPLLWLAARRTGYARRRTRWPGRCSALRASSCLMLSYSRGALIALGDRRSRSGSPPCRCGCAAVAALVGSALAAVPVVLWAFAQDGLTVDRAPMAARVDAGPRARRAAAAARRRARRRPGSPSASSRAAAPAGRAHAPDRRPRPARRRSRSCPSRSLIALAASPGGIGGQTTRGLEPAHRPAGAHPGQHARTGSPRPRRCARSYWDEALKVHADQHGGRHRRRRLRDRRAPATARTAT